MKSKLEVYALTVCFASVICLVISISISGYSVVRILHPGLTMTSSYLYHNLQTNDNYWKNLYVKSDTCNLKRPTEEELTKKRLAALQNEFNDEKRQGLQNLIQSLMFVIAGALTLIIHWQIAKRARAG